MYNKDMGTLTKLLIFHLLFKFIDCSAIVSVELLNYRNARGATAFGKKCDLWPGGRDLPCDPVFHICISPRPSNTKKCAWTRAWLNKNEITFAPGMQLGYGMKNPILYKFKNPIQGEITIDITTKDEDGLFDDQLDMFRKTIKLGQTPGENDVTLNGDISTLKVRIRTLCIGEGRESDCMKKCIPVVDSKGRWICRRKKPCVPRDDELGHYDCDEITGKIKCLQGWTDPSRKCLNDVRSEVSCSPNYMRIDIDRKYFDPSKYSQITLLDRSCKATISKTHITLDTMPQLCGAIKGETEDHIIYENEVYMKATPTLELVTREHDVRVKFKCSYQKKDVTGWTSFRPLTSIDVQADAAFLYTRPDEQTFSYGKKGYSSLTFNFKMFKDNSFKEVQKKFPVNVKLNHSMFFEVTSTSSDNDLVLLIDRCYATPATNAKNKLKYTFIDSGCARDKTVKFFEEGRKQRRFGLNTFSFIKRSKSVFMHCVLFMCRKSSADGKCLQGCNKENLGRAKRDLARTVGKKEASDEKKPYTQYYLLDIGPVQGDLGINFENSKGKGKSGTDAFPVVTVALIIGVSLLGVIATAMLIWMIVKKSPQYQQSKSTEN